MKTFVSDRLDYLQMSGEGNCDGGAMKDRECDEGSGGWRGGGGEQMEQYTHTRTHKIWSQYKDQ